MLAEANPAGDFIGIQKIERFWNMKPMANVNLAVSSCIEYTYNANEQYKYIYVILNIR